MRNGYSIRFDSVSQLTQVRIFLLLSDILTLIYSSFNILFIIIPEISVLVIPAFLFALLREVFYYFFGLFWIKGQFDCFINPIIISLILGCISFLQLILVLKPKFYFSKFYFISITFLLFNLTLIPFGLVSIYFLYIVLNNYNLKNELVISLVYKPVKKTDLQKAWSRISIMIFNYIIAFFFLNIIQIIRITTRYSLDFFLLGTLLICTLVSILAFCIIGFVFFDD